MNNSRPTDPLPSPAPHKPIQGPFVALQRLINTAGLTSVDLTDTIFASLPRQDGAPREAVLPPNCSE